MPNLSLLQTFGPFQPFRAVSLSLIFAHTHRAALQRPGHCWGSLSPVSAYLYRSPLLSYPAVSQLCRILASYLGLYSVTEHAIPERERERGSVYQRAFNAPPEASGKAVASPACLPHKKGWGKSRQKISLQLSIPRRLAIPGGSGFGSVAVPVIWALGLLTSRFPSPFGTHRA